MKETHRDFIYELTRLRNAASNRPWAFTNWMYSDTLMGKLKPREADHKLIEFLVNREDKILELAKAATEICDLFTALNSTNTRLHEALRALNTATDKTSAERLTLIEALTIKADGRRGDHRNPAETGFTIFDEACDVIRNSASEIYKRLLLDNRNILVDDA